VGFGLFIIGDEILSGKREDGHFPRVRSILAARGLRLDWVSYLGDERERLTRALKHSFAGGDVVFSCGGIGSTPDDHTRQAAAAALGRPLVAHPEAQALIAQRVAEAGHPLTAERLAMGEFPEGAEIIPNPVNRIPGFSVESHYFVPGFPAMAWPMLEWVLDNHYADRFHHDEWAERSLMVEGIAEATLTPLMQSVEREFPGLRTFSLPQLDLEKRSAYRTEIGVKGPAPMIDAAFERLVDGIAAVKGRAEEGAS